MKTIVRHDPAVSQIVQMFIPVRDLVKMVMEYVPLSSLVETVKLRWHEANTEPEPVNFCGLCRNEFVFDKYYWLHERSHELDMGPSSGSITIFTSVYWTRCINHQSELKIVIRKSNCPCHPCEFCPNDPDFYALISMVRPSRMRLTHIWTFHRTNWCHLAKIDE